MLVSSWVIDGREEELGWSCTRRGGEGRVLSVDRRVEGSGSVPNLGSGLEYGTVIDLSGPLTRCGELN